MTDEELLRLAVRRGLMAPELVEDCKRLRQEVLENGFECGLLEAVLLRQALTLDDIRVLARDEDPDEAVHTGFTEVISDETRIADLALARGSVTLDQYRAALQARASRNAPLDEILVEMGFLAQDVREALRRHSLSKAPRPRPLKRSEIKFGDQLVALGFLSPSQLERGLKLQQAVPSQQKLGETLVTHDLMTQSQLDEALLRFDRLPPVSPPGYVLEYRLGTGYTGAVFKGRYSGREEDMAVKLYYPSISGSRAFGERFQSDVTILKGLKIPGIPAVPDAGFLDPGRIPFVAAELVRGVTLAGLVHSRGTLDPVEALRIIADVARILRRASEKGISHRALGPRNILLAVDGRAHVTDWAVPLLLSKTEQGAGSSVPANVPARAYQFLSPEAILGEPCDERSDVYVLGALLYFCVAGRAPFMSESVSELFVMQIKQSPEPPPALPELILKMMAKKPEQRTASLRDLESELRRAATGLPAPPPRPFVPRRMDLWKRAARPRAPFVVALLLTILGAGVFHALPRLGPFEPSPEPEPPRQAFMIPPVDPPKPEPRILIDLQTPSRGPIAGDPFTVFLKITNRSDKELPLALILERVVVGDTLASPAGIPDEFKSPRGETVSIRPGEEREFAMLVSGSDVLVPGRPAACLQALDLDAKITLAPATLVSPGPEEAEAFEVIRSHPDILRGWRGDRFTNEQYRAAADFLEKFPGSRYAAEVRLTMARIYEVGISSYSSGKRVFSIQPSLEKADACLDEVKHPALQVMVAMMRAFHAEERAHGPQEHAALKREHGNHLAFRASRFCR